MIQVTLPFLPPIETYNSYVANIYKNGWLTNNGPLVQELEAKLKDFLKVDHLFFVGNGTVALQIAIKALDLKGDIITTPFSYVATTASILWEGCRPVFADINDTDYNINPDCIEALITENTCAILATHVYGNPCDVDRLEALCKKHNLKLIYDGAHAYGVMYNNKHLLTYGDITTCSFHATKIFHTIEGGCIITKNEELAKKVMLYRQFGHVNDDYYSIGINGKNSEFHAAMGLAVMPYFNDILAKRKEICNTYNRGLAGLNLKTPRSLPNTIYNYAYYPVTFENEIQLLKTKKILADNNIFCRRYFYPSLNTLPYYKGERCVISEKISLSVLALPLYYTLEETDVIKIIKIIKQSFN